MQSATEGMMEDVLVWREEKRREKAACISISIALMTAVKRASPAWVEIDIVNNLLGLLLPDCAHVGAAAEQCWLFMFLEVVT